MANNRIYYAIQQVTLGSPRVPVHGLQSAGLTTNFNLEQVFEIGQLAIYQNIENIPEIELSLNKVLDGYPLIYTLATEAGTAISASLVASGPDISGRQNARCDMELSIYPDTQSSAAGNTGFSKVSCQGMYVNSVSYTFPVDGSATEDVTLVGNDKIWGTTASGFFNDNNDSPAALAGVVRRQHFDMSESLFPTQIPGIDSNGLNQPIGEGSGNAVHFQNVTVSCDLGREALFELGTMVPYHRYVTFPVEVTSEFEVIAVSGDGINATESGYYTGDYTYGGTVTVATGTDPCLPRFNLLDQRIYIKTCEGTKIHLGDKNKLSSVNYGGGDTGGGNVTVTYSYTNFNDFVVAHSGGDFYANVDENGYTP
jgi:hypothetical protein